MELKDLGYNLLELLQTEGVYVVSDGHSLIICHRCTLEDPRNITLEGECMYVLFARGDLKALLTHTDPDVVKTIIFERNMDGKYRYLDFKKLYDRLS